jgi:uncharacterized protein (DUF697 family)
MVEPTKGWVRRRIEGAIAKGLTEAYQTMRVDPERYLMQLRAGHGLPVSSYAGMFTVPTGRLDELANEAIRAGMKMAAAEGAGLGMGGMLTVVPDLGILAAITIRMIQKLSLIYGFEFNTDEEVADLWIAAASAAGVDIGREVVEKQFVNRFVPRVVEKIAVQAGKDIAEKWAGRVIPVVSSAIGGTLNYYFVRAWGERGMHHFRQKHMQMRNGDQRSAVSFPENQSR